MQTSKKKPSMLFLLLGAVLAGYLGYLIGGAWEQGIDLMEFMDRFNVVCAAPFANYFNENSVKCIAIVVVVYSRPLRVVMRTGQKHLFICVK